MASKIQGHTFYVAITPYKVEGSSADVFNELSVRAAYDSGRKYFYVDLHAGWTTGWDGHGCILMGDDDPLTAPKYVKVKDAPKNSQKTINEMGANLEQAKDAIAWLFDKRDWTRLYAAVRNIALYGYTEQFRKQMEALINSNNNQSKEDENMRLNINSKNESANVQNAQVNNPSNETIDVNVGEVSVNDIMPKMVEEPAAPTKQEVAEAISKAANEGKATTMPLGDHGTLVIGGCGFTPKTTKSKTPQASSIDHSPFLLHDVTQASQSAERTIDHSPSSLPRVTLVVYTTKRGEQAPRIEGFGGENDPRWKRHYDDKVRLAQQKKEADAFNEKLQAKMKGKSKDEREKLRKQWKSVGSDPFGASYFTDRTTGDKYYQMTMGAKYMEVARELVAAYNGGDEQAIATAEQAVIDCKNGIVKDIEAQRDAKRAEREAKKSEERRVKSEESATASTGYSDQDVAEMLRKVMAGGDVPENIKKLLMKAA